VRAAGGTVAGDLLQEYADRGIFRGFSRGVERNGRTVYKVVWHRDRPLDVVVDTRQHRVSCPLLLPQAPADSEMYRALREFVRSRQDADLPEHRRIDPGKARAVCANRGGDVSLALKILDGDYEYGVRKFVHLVHEIFVAFLSEYLDYQVEVFELDPDRP
jgi:hypothetical protein